MIKKTYKNKKEMAQVQTYRKPRHRTYGRNRVQKSLMAHYVSEGDGIYLLKLVVVVLMGTLWLKLAIPMEWNGMPIAAFPLGGLVALVGIRLFEKNQLDRKIWFAVLVIVTILSYFVPAGIVL